MRQLNETFEDDDFRELERVKGSRMWREAILQEFGVKEE